VNTTIRRRPRRGADATLAASALVGLLAICTGPISVFSVLRSPERNSAEGRSVRASATPSGGAPTAPAASIPGSGDSDGAPVGIELVADGEIITATLADTPEARDFAAMLPITVDMEDRFGQAKTGLLPRALPLDDPSGSRHYAAGDLSYWSPSGRIAVVYDALGRSVPPPGLVRLGTVDSGLRAIAGAGNDFTMTIRRGR
jgi:hypothetical protein